MTPKQEIANDLHHNKYEIIEIINDKQILIKTKRPLDYTPEYIRINKTWYAIETENFRQDNGLILKRFPLYVITLDKKEGR